MLVEILCEQFNDKRIVFHAGLNVVLGDENGTNSIGKSTLLMVIDFVFGGNTFLKHNEDVIRELGHHHYNFCFNFGGRIHYFERRTENPKIVFKCSEAYEKIEAIDINRFTDFLKAEYSIKSSDISFRAFVGLFSRVWGKENIDVARPLHSAVRQKSSECVDNLIKAFNQFEGIRELLLEAATKSNEKSALSAAFKRNIIPKINSSKYKENLNTLAQIKNEIDDIKANLAKYATNLSEVINREVLDLKKEKDELLRAKFDVDNRLARVKSNLSENHYIKSKHLESLVTFFPDVNLEKLEGIEAFHSGLSRILKTELKRSEKLLQQESDLLQGKISDLDKRIAQAVTSIDNPGVIVDRVYSLSKSWQASASENKYYEEDKNTRESLRSLKDKILEKKGQVLKHLEEIINKKIHNVVDSIYFDARKSPVLTLAPDNYKYQVFEDTGTGKAYSNLVVLDVSVFQSTELPFLIHDSLLFKNIENDAVANLISIYAKSKRQVFIAIDEISKYGEAAAKTLYGSRVVELTNGHVLYIRDWRKKGGPTRTTGG